MVFLIQVRVLNIHSCGTKWINAFIFLRAPDFSF